MDEEKRAVLIAGRLRQKPEPTVSRVVSESLDVVYRSPEPRYAFKPVLEYNGEIYYRREPVSDWRYLVPIGRWVVNRVNRRHGYAIAVVNGTKNPDDFFALVNVLTQNGYNVLTISEDDENCYNPYYVSYQIGRLLHHQYLAYNFDFFSNTWIEWARYLKQRNVNLHRYEVKKDYFEEAY